MAADSKIVGDKFNSLPKGLQYIGTISGGEKLQLETGPIYLGVYTHSAHSVCAGLYIIHRGSASHTQTSTNMMTILSCSHVTSLVLDSSSQLNLSTDSWGGWIYVYKFLS